MVRRLRGRGHKPLEALSKLVLDVYPPDAPDEAVAQRLFGCWASVVSERILKNALPVSYRSSVLTVHTTTASWANALSLESTQLLQRLRARVPGVALSRLAFRVGKLPVVPERVAPEAPPLRMLPLEELPEEAARELARISDDALRTQLQLAMTACLAEREPKPKKRGL